jgi:hypothetical protein
MFKMKSAKEADRRNIVLMKDMKPLEIGRIVTSKITHCYSGEIVMRTASKDKFEVMSLSHPAIDHCWTGSPSGLSTLKDVFKLIKNQVDTPSEVNKLIDEHFWELFKGANRFYCDEKVELLKKGTEITLVVE